jgi:hypothetical protein
MHKNNSWTVWFTWIGDDLRTLATHLRRLETWLLLGMMLTFGALLFAAFYYALRFDFTMQIWKFGGLSCQQIGNLQAIAIIYAVVAFVLAAITALGEFGHFIDNKRRHYPEARKHGRSTLILLLVTMGLGLGMIAFLHSIC